MIGTHAVLLSYYYYLPKQLNYMALNSSSKISNELYVKLMSELSAPIITETNET